MPGGQEGLLRAELITPCHSSSSSNLRLVRLQPYRFLLATFILLPFPHARESLRAW